MGVIFNKGKFKKDVKKITNDSVFITIFFTFIYYICFHIYNIIMDDYQNTILLVLAFITAIITTKK